MSRFGWRRRREGDCRFREERRKSGDGHDCHLGYEGVDNRLEFRPLQSEIDAPSSFGDGAVCGDQHRRADRSKDSAGASAARGRNQDRRIHDEHARWRPHKLRA